MKGFVTVIPWHLTPAAGGEGPRVVDNQGRLICFTYEQGDYAEACARLIATAPELLAALRGAIGALEFSRDYHMDLSNEDQAFAQDRLDAAVAAIAKAASP